MTIDEAIIHCEEVADRCAITDGDRRCEQEHRQLAEWLKELKRYQSVDEQDDNRLYIKIYADDEPSRKAEKLYQICGETENQEVAQWLKEYFPSADRPTGEWIEVDSFESEKHSVTDMRCSLCGKYASMVLPHRTRCVYDYCPNCGAKMKGGEDE